MARKSKENKQNAPTVSITITTGQEISEVSTTTKEKQLGIKEERL